ncbi:MAG: VTT domain-containing protein [Verrucomicrobiota bacterium]
MKFLKEHWKIIAGLLALVALILATRKLPVLEWLQHVAEPLRNMGWAGVALFALMYFIAGLLCLPCMPLALTAGYIFGTVQGVLVVHTAAVSAAAAGFLIGRMLGRKKAAAWLRKSERFHFLDEAIEQEGWKIVGLLRMQALPFGVSNYLYGMTKINFWQYLLATAIAMLPGHFILVHLASVGGKHLSGRGDIGTVEWVSLGLAILSKIALVILATRMFRKHQRVKRD